MSNDMNARGILGICKVHGHVEVTPGFMLFTKGFLKVGRTVDLGSSYRVQIKKVFPNRYILTFLNGTTGELKSAGLDSEADVLFVLNETFKTAREMGYTDYSQLFSSQNWKTGRI